MKPGTDTIDLFTGVFKGIGKKGPLKAKYFHVGKNASDSDDHIIYRKAAGELSYDRNGKGGADQLLFAKVDRGLGLGADDFLLIAS
jgi:hypothetical protein